jgi:hypothetical protein
MHILKWFIGIVFFSIFIISCYLAWENRAANKVINNFFIVIFLAATGTLVSTLFSIEKKHEKIVFHKSYIFHKVSKLPFNDLKAPWLIGSGWLGYRTSTIVKAAIEQDQSLTSLKDSKTDNDEIGKAEDLYKKVLMREILEALFLCCRWRAETTHSNDFLTLSISSSRPPDLSEVIKLRWSDISFDKAENNLFKSESLEFIHDFYVPKGTKVKLLKDKIYILNPFVNIDISVHSYHGSIGTGIFQHMLKLPESENLKYWTHTYIINVEADFNAYKSGHPQMKDYEDWIDKIFKELSIFFDSQKHLEKARDAYTFFKDVNFKRTESLSEAYSKHQKWFLKLKENNKNQFKEKKE